MCGLFIFINRRDAVLLTCRIFGLPIFYAPACLLAEAGHVAFRRDGTFVTRFKFTCKFRCKFMAVFLAANNFYTSGLES